MHAQVQLAPTLIPEGQGTAQLTIFIDGPNGRHERYLFQPKSKLIIGRSRDCDIIIDDPYISRKHAEVGVRFGECWIRNTGLNPSRINSERCRPNYIYSLNQDDTFMIGKYQIRVYVTDLSQELDREEDTVVVFFSEHWKSKATPRPRRQKSALTRRQSKLIPLQ